MEKAITSIPTTALSARRGFLLTARDSFVMAYRGLLKIKRTPELLLDVTIMPIVFTLMFSYLFGGAISGNVQSYLPLVIPGILVQAILTGTVAIGVQLREDMNKGVFDRFRSLPIARVAPLAGALLADTVRYAIVTILTLTMGYIMGFRPAAGWGGVLAASMLVIVFAWCISWIFALFGVLARTTASVQGISMMILFPLTFLSNAFVPTDTLPSGLKWFANINPVSHLIAAVRDLLNKGVAGNDFWWSLLGAFVILAIFAPLTIRMYSRKA